MGQTLRWPLEDFRACLQEAAGGSNGFHTTTRPVVITAGSPGLLLVAQSAHSPPGGWYVRLTLADRFLPAMDIDRDARCLVILQTGAAGMLGQLRVSIRSEGGWQALAHGELQLPGPGVQRIYLDARGESVGESLPSSPLDHSWSRSRAALGAEAIARRQQICAGFVGVGRLGSALLGNFLAAGPARGVVLADPDIVESHNVNGGGYSSADVGQRKVHALENRLAISHPDLDVEAIPESVTHRLAIDAMSRCDLIFSAPDNPGARLAAAAIASAYSIVLIDAGSRISVDRRTMGIDVRLIIPGERCLLCMGSVEDEELGRQILASPDFEGEFMATRDWQTERAGSLLSLNLMAVSTAMRIFEDLLTGKLQHSTWIQIDTGGAEMKYRTVDVTAKGRESPCACRFAGWGNAGLREIGRVLAARQSNRVSPG